MNRAEPLYTKQILRLAASIPHLGPLAGAQGSADQRSPTCGSSVRVEVRLGRDGRVAALGHEVSACAFGQAAAALMAGNAIGRSGDEVAAACTALAEWLAGKRHDPGGWPGLEALAPARSRTARHGAMLIPFAALEAAIAAAKGK